MEEAASGTVLIMTNQTMFKSAIGSMWRTVCNLSQGRDLRDPGLYFFDTYSSANSLDLIKHGTYLMYDELFRSGKVFAI